MKHNWTKQPDKQTLACKVKVWICKVCGCEKTLGYYKFAEPDYDRNGQHYSHYVECINYELEDLKTID